MGHIALRHMGVRTLHFATQTITGLTANLSMVDTLAFITNPSTDLGQYAGCKLTLIDTAGKKAIGWLGAKGTGETFTDIIGGTNPALQNGDFSAGDTVWIKESGWAITDVATFSFPAAYTYLYQANILPLSPTGILFKTIVNITTAGPFRIGSTPGFLSDQYKDTGVKTLYWAQTANNRATGIRGDGSGVLDDVCVQQVLTPSATGATILSTLGGAQSFWFNDTAFNPNSAAFTAIVEG